MKLPELSQMYYWNTTLKASAQSSLSSYIPLKAYWSQLYDKIYDLLLVFWVT